MRGVSIERYEGGGSNNISEKGLLQKMYIMVQNIFQVRRRKIRSDLELEFGNRVEFMS